MPNLRQVLFGLSLAVLAARAATATPVALVLEVSGGVDPAVEAFEEIAAGTSISLAAGTRLVFSHYPSCREVTVEGGSVHFTAQKFLLKAGRVVDEKRIHCPRTIALPKEGRIGGLTMRTPVTKLEPTPRFLFLGRDAVAIERVRITHPSGSPFERSVDKRQFAWPLDAAPLSAGKDYVLELLAKDSNALRRFAFEVSTSARPASITIIRLD